LLADCTDQGEPGTVVQDSDRRRPGDELRGQSGLDVFLVVGRGVPPSPCFLRKIFRLLDLGLDLSVCGCNWSSLAGGVRRGCFVKSGGLVPERGNGQILYSRFSVVSFSVVS